MGSLEQQMALFEELISQEHAPSNGIIVPRLHVGPTHGVVSIAPGLLTLPPARGIVSIAPTRNIVNIIARSNPAIIATSAPAMVVTTRPMMRQGTRLTAATEMALRSALSAVHHPVPRVVPRPQPTAQGPLPSVPSLDSVSLPGTPSLESISLPGDSRRRVPEYNIHPSRIPLPPAPPSPPAPTGPPPSKKHKPRLYEKESESLELKAAIAKATAAANATNTKDYPQPHMHNNSYNGPPHQPSQHHHRPPGPRHPMGSHRPPAPHHPPGPHRYPPPQTIPPPPPMMGPMRPPGPPDPKHVAMYYASMGGPQPASSTPAVVAEDAKVKKKEKKDKRVVRVAAGDVWEDSSLLEWDPNDFRIFVGDIGNECNDEMLYRAFSKYTSLVKVKVVRDKRSNKTKGYGFASFTDANDYIKAMREVNGKYIGNRPCKLRKSTWKDRQLSVVRKKNYEKKQLGLKV